MGYPLVFIYKPTAVIKSVTHISRKVNSKSLPFIVFAVFEKEDVILLYF